VRNFALFIILGRKALVGISGKGERERKIENFPERKLIIQLEGFNY